MGLLGLIWTNMPRGGPGDQRRGAQIREQIERRQGALWHGNLSIALDTIEALESLIAICAEPYPKHPALAQAVQEFCTDLGKAG